MTPEIARPRVSVVVNTYNHEKFIVQALRSVRAQTHPANAMEIIVVDDGSIDRTPQLLGEFLPFINYIRQENSGQVSAFNTGVSAARGEILAFLDGDDWWAPGKLARIVAEFDANPDVAAVGHGYYEVDEEGTIIATISPGVRRYLSFDSPTHARELAPFRIFLGTSRLAIRRSVLDVALPVPPELPFFDAFIFSHAIAMSGAVILPDPLCYYRIHAGSLYAGNSTDQKKNWTRYKLLCGHLKHIPGRLAKMGIPEDVIFASMEFDYVDRDRLKLMLEGGKPSETFNVERTAYQLSCPNPSFGYRCFKSVSLLLALLMPPKAFYAMHGWYSKHGLRRVREWIVDASALTPQVVRRRANTESERTRA
jgi:glycosyltransferase involved in cell wall biosynthesis